MLTEILEAKITTKLVRLGSRSSDERVAEYTLDKLEKLAARSMNDRAIGRQFAVMKELEERMVTVMRNIQLPTLDWGIIEQHLQIYSSRHAEGFENPPYWIQQLYFHKRRDAEENGEWSTAHGKQKKGKGSEELTGTLYDFWQEGEDIAFITPPPTPQKQKEKSPQDRRALPTPTTLDQHVLEFFAKLGSGAQLPPIPQLTRPTSTLLKTPQIWSMSLGERKRLAAEWARAIRQQAYHAYLGEYKRLREQYKEACAEFNDIRDEVRVTPIGDVPKLTEAKSRHDVVCSLQPT